MKLLLLFLFVSGISSIQSRSVKKDLRLELPVIGSDIVVKPYDKCSYYLYNGTPSILGVPIYGLCLLQNI